MTDPDPKDPDPKKEARRTARRAAKEARRAETEVENAAARARDAVEQSLGAAGRYAHDAADAHIAQAADGVAEQAERAAQAARDAGAAGAAHSADRVEASVLDDVSRLLEDTADRLRKTDLDTAARDLAHFGRRNPVTFLAGAATLGFAAARLLRADDTDRAGVEAREDGTTVSPDPPQDQHAAGETDVSAVTTRERKQG